MGSTVQADSRARVIFETVAKATIFALLAFTLVTHVYALGLLHAWGSLPELTGSMVVLDALLLGGGLAFLLVAEGSRRGPALEWPAYFANALVLTFVVVWQVEYFHPFEAEGLTFMAVPAAFVLAWVALMLVTLGYLLPAGVVLLAQAVSRVRQGASTPRPGQTTRRRVVTALLFVLPLASMALAIPATNAFVAEGTVKRTVTYLDTNADATLAIWDYPKIDVQVGDTRAIDLTALTANETRLLTAFGRMNTTFYYQLHFETPRRANQTVARLKLLEAFNCTVCPTIWYSPAVSAALQNETGKSFPTAHHAGDWIAQARATLEFVVANNLTNVMGICADSEGTATVSSLPEYWENVALYEAFLREVQVNASLRNPRPGQATFETVLCTGPRFLTDLLDGDTHTFENRRAWGKTGFAWTKYHFMLYRGPPTANPAVLYEYLLLLKNYLGTADVAPIVGLTGTLWFAEGYYAGTAENFDRSPQRNQYDGIDGWAAMKREILIGKAMGFDTVSVFHLNKYGDDPGVWENYGLLDYYGLEAIEELAAEWHQEQPVEYPVSSLQVKLSTRGLFPPHDELLYDLVQNPEMQGLQVVLFGLVAGLVAWNLRRAARRRRAKR